MTSPATHPYPVSTVAPSRAWSLQSTSLAFVMCGVVTSSWNGLRAGPGLALCDVFFVLGAVCWLMASTLRRSTRLVVPPWLVVAVCLLAFDVLLSTIAAEAGSSSLVPGFRFAVAMLLTPIVIGATVSNRRDLGLLVDCWIFSIAVSAAIGASDYFLHTHIGEGFTGVVTVERAAGLATQVNHLAFACVFALPIACFRALQANSKGRRFVYFTAVLLAMLGIVVTGSRGGAVGGAFVVLTLPFFQSVARGLATKSLAVVALVIVVGVMAVPPASSLIVVQRLTTSESARAGVEKSDEERHDARDLAIHQAESSPLYGVGFTQVRDAHNIYLQLVSAGGILGLAAFLTFLGGAIRSSYLFSRSNSFDFELRELAGAVCSTFVVWLLMGLVENQIYDRYLFVPCGLFMGCMAVARLRVPRGAASTEVP